MNHVVVTDKKSNFIAIVLTPIVCALVPAVGGFLLAGSRDPVLTLLVIIAVVISGLLFHIMALDWRDTKLSNVLLSKLLKERDEELARLKWENE